MRRSSLTGIAPLQILGAVACTTARLATPSGEAKLGADAAAEVERQIGLVRAPALESYLDAIGQRLSADPTVRTAGLHYRFQIMDLAEPNAIASEDAILRGGQPVKVARWQIYREDAE